MSFEVGDDLIDVRDVIKRYEELESQRDDASTLRVWKEESPEEYEEFDALDSLLLDLKGRGGDEQWRGDWYPITLIHESYFVEYCKELCADIGDIPRELPSYIAIDWEKTSDNLKVDYSEVEINGHTYLYR
jgi:hypothetical protein